MNKQTFTIPEGCTEISVEQNGDKLIATFGKSSKFEPKEGDVCAMAIEEYENPLIFFYTHKRGNSVADGLSTVGVYCPGGIGLHNDGDMLKIRLATPEESKKLFDALEKEGLQWDAENKKLVKMRWKPFYTEQYFYLSCEEPAFWENNKLDAMRFSIGDCFKTNEDRLAALDLLRQTLINFHNEN